MDVPKPLLKHLKHVPTYKVAEQRETVAATRKSRDSPNAPRGAPHLLYMPKNWCSFEMAVKKL
jgi:hypothetical protein